MFLEKSIPTCLIVSSLILTRINSSTFLNKHIWDVDCCDIPVLFGIYDPGQNNTLRWECRWLYILFVCILTLFVPLETILDFTLLSRFCSRTKCDYSILDLSYLIRSCLLTGVNAPLMCTCCSSFWTAISQWCLKSTRPFNNDNFVIEWLIMT